MPKHTKDKSLLVGLREIEEEWHTPEMRRISSEGEPISVVGLESARVAARRSVAPDAVVTVKQEPGVATSSTAAVTSAVVQPLSPATSNTAAHEVIDCSSDTEDVNMALPPPVEKWECECCTYRNLQKAKICMLCEASRPRQRAKAAASRSHATAAATSPSAASTPAATAAAAATSPAPATPFSSRKRAYRSSTPTLQNDGNVTMKVENEVDAEAAADSGAKRRKLPDAASSSIQNSSDQMSDADPPLQEHKQECSPLRPDTAAIAAALSPSTDISPIATRLRSIIDEAKSSAMKNQAHAQEERDETMEEHEPEGEEEGEEESEEEEEEEQKSQVKRKNSRPRKMKPRSSAPADDWFALKCQPRDEGSACDMRILQHSNVFYLAIADVAFAATKSRNSKEHKRMSSLLRGFQHRPHLQLPFMALTPPGENFHVNVFDSHQVRAVVESRAVVLHERLREWLRGLIPFLQKRTDDTAARRRAAIAYAKEQYGKDDSCSESEAEEFTPGASAPNQPSRAPSDCAAENHDAMCFFCQDGGDLLMCDARGCVRAYHLGCLKEEGRTTAAQLRALERSDDARFVCKENTTLSCSKRKRSILMTSYSVLPVSPSSPLHASSYDSDSSLLSFSVDGTFGTRCEICREPFLLMDEFWRCENCELEEEAETQVGVSDICIGCEAKKTHETQEKQEAHCHPWRLRRVYSKIQHRFTAEQRKKSKRAKNGADPGAPPVIAASNAKAAASAASIAGNPSAAVAFAPVAAAAAAAGLVLVPLLPRVARRKVAARAPSVSLSPVHSLPASSVAMQPISLQTTTTLPPAAQPSRASLAAPTSLQADPSSTIQPAPNSFQAPQPTSLQAAQPQSALT